MPSGVKRTRIEYRPWNLLGSSQQMTERMIGMDIQSIAFKYNKSTDDDERVRLIRAVARRDGYDGIRQLSRLVDRTPEYLWRYAAVDRYLEDRNRRRRGRKPKARNKTADQIEAMIFPQIEPWLYQDACNPRKRA